MSKPKPYKRSLFNYDQYEKILVNFSLLRDENGAVELRSVDFHDMEELHEMRQRQDYDPQAMTAIYVAANDNGDDLQAKRAVNDDAPEVLADDTRKQQREKRVGESHAPPPLSEEAEQALKNYRFNRQIKNAVSKRTYLEAVKLVARGFACVPVHSLDEDGNCTCEWRRKKDAARYDEEFAPKCQAPGKHPKLAKWQERAGRSIGRIQDWFSEPANQYSPANLGIVTGKDQGVLVIDIDGPGGLASLERMQREWGELPATVTSVTGSGGRHLLFRYPEGWDIRNSASMLGGKGSKVDVRGENGFIVAAGSVHKSGNRYVWLVGHSPDDLMLADLPPRWIEEAYGVTKAHQAEKAKPDSARQKASKGQNPSRRASTNSSALTFYDIGDHKGGSGFNTPINSILCSFFIKNGPDADYEPIRKEISAHVEHLIAAGLVDKGKGREVYTIGGGKLDSMIEDAREFARTNGRGNGKLTDMNEKFAVVKVAGSVKIVDLQDGEGYSFMSQTDFRLLLSNQTIQIGEDRRPLADEWLKWSERRTFAGIEFAPGGGRGGYLNLFTGLPYEAKRHGDDDGYGGGWALLESHIFENICHENEEWYHWLMTWFADIVQNPETKRGSCVIVRGEQGVGKSIVFDLFRELLGGAAVKLDSIERLTGRFNSCLSAKILAHLDEGMWAGNRADQSKMKNLVTASSMFIERKGLEGWEEPNFIRVAITSNDRWLMSMSEDDRRYFILECADTRQNDSKFFADMWREMRNGGFEAWMYDLTQWEPDPDKGGWEMLRKPPTTLWAKDQIALSKRPEERFFDRLKRGEQVDYVKDGNAIQLSFNAPTKLDREDLAGQFDAFMKNQRTGWELIGNETMLARFCKEHFPEFEKKREWRGKDRVMVYIFPALKDDSVDT